MKAKSENTSLHKVFIFDFDLTLTKLHVWNDDFPGKLGNVRKLRDGELSPDEVKSTTEAIKRNLKTGAIETLRDLLEKGHIVIIASNNLKYVITKYLEIGGMTSEEIAKIKISALQARWSNARGSDAKFYDILQVYENNKNQAMFYYEDDQEEREKFENYGIKVDNFTIINAEAPENYSGDKADYTGHLEHAREQANIMLKQEKSKTNLVDQSFFAESKSEKLNEKAVNNSGNCILF